MAPTRVSPMGERFIFDKEGSPTHAYKDVGGVVTIGPGFTMLSRAFSAYWLKTRGHKLRLGDTLTLAEARKIFPAVLHEEYASRVLSVIRPKEQHHLDGASSVAYNAGPGSLKWKWAQALAAGDIVGAARLLLTTAITSGGKVWNGLKKRRAAEGRLIEHADYGFGDSVASAPASAISSTPEEIKEYQRQLTKLNLYKGAIDGKAGKGSLTEGAVKNFQRAEGLKVDGVVGPATRAALRRKLGTDVQNTTAIGGGLLTGGGGSFLQFDNPWTLLMVGGGAVLLLFVLFTLWNNRGVIFRVRTPA